MIAPDLGGKLLASVSRSFYLTIQLLPPKLRAPIGLGYLLARASDTIADSHKIPADTRLEQLAAYEQMVRTGNRTGLVALQEKIFSPNESERSLIERLGECLDWLDQQEEADRKEIVSVLQKIIEGQKLDILRFQTPEIAALVSADELDEYTYLVAGCVGEFWTRVCTRHLPRYSKLDSAELCRLGVSFGKGLQLVNILRDSPADLKAGRCYLPADELAARGLAPDQLLNNPIAARSVFQKWIAQAGRHLDDAHAYIASLHPLRLRAACFLPWSIGLATLRLMEKDYPLESPERLKVSRRTVQFTLLQAIPVSFSNLALDYFGRK